jgi:hypothetical protein
MSITHRTIWRLVLGISLVVPLVWSMHTGNAAAKPAGI